MPKALKVVVPSLLVLCVVTSHLKAEDDGAKKLVEQVVKTAGGEEKLLNLFRFRERVLVSAAPAAPVTADEQGNRTSVVQVSGDPALFTSRCCVSKGAGIGLRGPGEVVGG